MEHWEALCHGGYRFDSFISRLSTDDTSPDTDPNAIASGFLSYLYDSLNGNTPANYFKKFREFLDTMLAKGIVTENAARNLSLKYYDYRVKSILTLSDIHRLETTPCRSDGLKRAFLFACCSGLRWSDIYNLRWDDIDMDNRTMTVRQQKVSEQFGVRTFEFSPQFGLKLNGEKVILKGIANHHTLGSLGAAAYPRAIEKRIKLLKSFGFNHIRCSHNPYSEDLYRLCDKYGIIVIDELYDKWLQQYAGGRTPWTNLWQHDIPEWVKRDRNHPSVALWSLGNELQQGLRESGVQMRQQVVQVA